MSVLRGPADADHYRAKVGRYGDRWYVDPLPADDIAPAADGQWPSVSTVKKASGSDWSFVALKRVAVELEDKPDALAGLDYAERYDRLKAINKLGLHRAGDRGTGVHLYFERALRGQPMETPFDNPAAKPYLPAVAAFFDAHQPELVAAELVCINRGLHGVGYGGTSDGLIRIDGKLYWVDWKSRGDDSSHSAYPEESGQLGGYSGADYFIAEGPKRMPMPAADGGLIVSIKPDGYRIYPIDLAKAQAAWADRHAWWCSRRSEREAVGKPWAPKAPRGLDDQIATAPSRAALEALYAQHEAVWDDDLTQLARARIALLEGGLVGAS